MNFDLVKMSKTASVLFVALAMAGCGGGSNNVTGMTDSTPPEPTVPQAQAVMMDLALGAAEQAALRVVLPATGDSDMLSIAAGEMETRGGVVFSCESMYPCTVTLTNNLGAILAEWSSMMLPDGSAMVMAGIPAPVITDPLHVQNAGNASTVAAILVNAIDTDANANDTPPTTERGAYSGANNVLGGLGLGDSGAHNIKGVTLTSALNPNTPFTQADGDTPASGGSTMMAMNEDGTYADYNMDAPNATVAATEGWNHKVLFRDWGDTADGGDGGYETGVLLYSDMEEPISHPFDDDLAGRYVNVGSWYALTVEADQDDAAVDGAPPGTSVFIPVTADTNSTQTGAMVFDSGSLVSAQDQDVNVDDNETFSGMYFGAPGKFQCVATTGCGLMRNDDGTVGLADTGDDPGLQSGTWTFTPDPGAMILVPDQDWLVYGAWLTTPDVVAGTHRVGVFFNGMDTYTDDNDNDVDVFTANDPNGLHGSATYSGGAAGVYVDGAESGMFTADASLTASFDVNGDAMADTGDYMLSGRIDNFMDTSGNYLGTDTADNPNDPMAGGENDWVVQLTATALGTGTITGVAPTGSADGVSWTGQWNAQLYGPGDTDADAVAPTGVAGSFRAITADIGTPGNPMYKGVAGGFGATMDMPDDAN